MKKFKATYQVEDGYAGGSRPRHFDISADDIEDDMNEEDLKIMFDDLMYSDFNDNIYPYPVQRSRDEFVKWGLNILEK